MRTLLWHAAAPETWAYGGCGPLRAQPVGQGDLTAASVRPGVLLGKQSPLGTLRGTAWARVATRAFPFSVNLFAFRPPPGPPNPDTERNLRLRCADSTFPVRCQGGPAFDAPHTVVALAIASQLASASSASARLGMEGDGGATSPPALGGQRPPLTTRKSYIFTWPSSTLTWPSARQKICKGFWGRAAVRCASGWTPLPQSRASITDR